MLTETLGRYQLKSELGRGGMGVVYLAWDAELERNVALKRLPSELVADPKLGRRFLHEARLAARVEHTNVVHIYDVGRAETGPYFAMEYVEGSDLDALLRQRSPLEVPEALRLLTGIAAGLDAAHAQGLVHRDIKPANILVTAAGVPKLVDFGLARAAASTGLTPDAGLVGTPQYLSPEQALGRPADHRSDLYSLGVIAYQMLVGRPPFEGGTAAATALRHVREAPPPARSLRPELPEHIEAALERALAKDPQFRFETASQLVRALAGREVDATPLPGRVMVTIHGELPAPAADVAALPTLAVPISRRRQRVMIANLVLAILAVALMFMLVMLPAGRAPNVKGMLQDSATHVLQRAGLTWTITYEASAETGAGRVKEQRPAAGTPLADGEAVALVVSSGAGGTRSPGDADEAVRNVVARWLAAWERQDLDDYLTCYWDDATIHANNEVLTFAEFRRHETATFDRTAKVSLYPQQPTVSIEGSRAKATFKMVFTRDGGRNGHYSSQGTQVLGLERRHGEWKLVLDQFLR